MNELKIVTYNSTNVTDSLEVAKMVGKEHRHLMRDIRQYCEILTETKIGLSDFFIESTYKDSTGRELPCFLITRKGCDMIAHKMTGKKGVIFTATYINAFEAMENALRAGETPLADDFKLKRAEAMARNAKVREASLWLKIADKVNTPSYKGICASYASKVLAGREVLPLPRSEEKHLSATEIGDMFGVSAQKIGSLANKHNLKTDVYGQWYHDKSRYSAKEVDVFKYNNRAVEKFAEILSA